MDPTFSVLSIVVFFSPFETFPSRSVFLKVGCLRH